MGFLDIIFILLAGLCAGFINVFAGGGSLISLPILIFLGLPSSIANGTNRVAIFFESLSGNLGYRSKGIKPPMPFSLWMGLLAFPGALIGAGLSVKLDDALFNKILAVVMIMIVIITLFKPFSKKKTASKKLLTRKRQIISGVLFFLIGIYGGFIQAGIGYLIIATLTTVPKFSLFKTNVTKLLVVFIYNLGSLLIFIIDDKIYWIVGLTLAIGNSTGAFIGSRLALKIDEKWIKRFILITVFCLSVKLWLN